MTQNNILNTYSLEEIFMIKSCHMSDKNIILNELEKTKRSVGNDIRNILSGCVEKIKKADINEIQAILEFPID